MDMCLFYFIYIFATIYVAHGYWLLVIIIIGGYFQQHPSAAMVQRIDNVLVLDIYG